MNYIGDIKDHRLRAEFYHIQHELAQIIMKEVIEKTGMFYEEGQMSREDVRTRVAAQLLDLKPFTKLGDFLPDMDGWHDMLEWLSIYDNVCSFSPYFLYDKTLSYARRNFIYDVIKPSSSTSDDHCSQGILGTINFVIYAYDMLLLFLPSLSLSVAQLYMLHIIDSCDDAGA